MFAEKTLIKKTAHHDGNFELQITALVDTLVIILIFLLKSMATDTLELEQGKGMKIPTVLNGISTGIGDRLLVTSDGISWNSTKFITLEKFSRKGDAAEWKTLSGAMADSAKVEKDKNEFTGKLFLQADKESPYSLVQEALKMAKTHGYKDIRFVGAKLN